jgi:hypothetical protein
VRRLAIAVVLVLALVDGQGEDVRVGIIDLYGLNRVPADRVREALTVKEGDVLVSVGGGRPATLGALEKRVAMVPGVARVRTEVVCCDEGRPILFVGIEETGAPTMTFRSAPVGEARLAADVVRAGEEFSQALTLAVQRGQAEEDRSEGHALNRDPAMRAIQERFLIYANRDLANVRLALRTSSDAGHRTLAAQVLGYAADKQAVVEDMVQAMADPSGEVRNSAIRALLVFAEMTPTATRQRPRIPSEPFIALLKSLVWSDRNKASGALLGLSANRDPGLLAT